MENATNITQIIIETINTIFETLFSAILDDITFIGSDILNDTNFEKIFGTSTSNGILLIANALLLGFLLYYAFFYLLSHLTYNKIESPSKFIIKMIIFRNLYEFFIFYYFTHIRFKL